MSTKKGNYYFQRHSLRAKLLKYLHCRQTLILICTLVILECMCVMAELMVDLQGIRVRLDNEETEVENFLQFMKSHNVSGVADFHGKSLSDVLKLVQDHVLDIRDVGNDCNCACENENSQQPNVSETKTRRKRSDKADNRLHSHFTNERYKTKNGDLFSVVKPKLENWLKTKRKLIYAKPDMTSTRRSTQTYKLIGALTNKNKNEIQHDYPVNSYDTSIIQHSIDSSSLKASHDTSTTKQMQPGDLDKSDIIRRQRRSAEEDEPSVVNVFIFSVNIQDSSLYLISHMVNITGTSVEQTTVETSNHFKEQTKMIQDVSHTIKYVGFCILTLMLCETLLKIACLGTTFLKRKIEVFDAFIVVVSFALDVVFIDSEWYESGKDATTILVLLLPWRVVRIVNSVMMTLNHKHKIEMMTVRRAKKRSDNKLRKLEQLSVEIRRDVELLINLCKVKGASEVEIDACIYNKGRGPTTLSAITSFASLMFISTLGKDPSQKDDFKDIYGDLIREVLEDEEEEEDSDTEKVESDLATNKNDADAVANEIYYVSRSYSTKPKSARISEHSDKSKRRATLPRRQGSCDENDKTVFYINDGYENAEEKGKVRRFTKKESKSMPTINKAKNRSNVVTFEVTTQVTYL